jgi:uncharacterized SAM-binding protein YcdF (DUF218 family)
MGTLFFLASKLFWTLARPESWIPVLLLAATLAFRRNRPRAGKRLLLTTIVLVLAIGTLPIGEALLRPLETRFQADPAVEAPRGIIVLGGGEDGRAMRASSLPEVNDAADRFLAGLALARRHPDAQLTFTEGNAAIIGDRISGAEVAQRIFADAGIAPARIHLEGASRNTAENAMLTRDLLDDPGDGPWLLVTSAFHMPRAMGAFCRAGWRGIVAYPVDYRGLGSVDVGWDLASPHPEYRGQGVDRSRRLSRDRTHGGPHSGTLLDV